MKGSEKKISSIFAKHLGSTSISHAQFNC